MIVEKSIYTFLEEVKPLNILLIEDDLASQFVIAKSLENLGNKLDITSSYEEAIKRTKVFAYDLILVDLNLPIVNGFELSKSIKARCEYKGSTPKILGLTGLDHPLLSTLISYSQIDDYIVKSIDYNELKSKIVNLCYLHLN